MTNTNAKQPLTTIKRIISHVNFLMPRSKLVSSCSPFKAAGDVTEIGGRARRNYDCLGRAALDACSEKADVMALQQGLRLGACPAASIFSTGSDSPVNVA